MPHHTTIVGWSLCALLSAACTGGDTGDSDLDDTDTGAAEDTGAADPGRVGNIRIFQDAVLAWMQEGVTIAHFPPACVVHQTVLETPYSDAGTLTVGGPIIGAEGAAAEPIVPALNYVGAYEYFGPTFPPTGEPVLEVSLSGLGAFPAMPVQTLTGPPSTAVSNTKPEPPGDGWDHLRVPSDGPFRVRWTPPASANPDNRLFVGLRGFYDWDSTTTVIANVFCSYDLSAGQGVIPEDVLDYILREVGRNPCAYFHVGVGDQVEYRDDDNDVSYVIELTNWETGTDPVMYDDFGVCLYTAN